MLRFFNFVIRVWHKFSFKQKFIFITCILLIVFGLIGTTIILFNHFTHEVPAPGGSLKLGLVGHLSSLNPILSQSNDCDRDLINLIYNGLYQINGKNELEPSLVEKIEISPDRKEYTIFLKDNILWHDGLPFTADDVVFTIEAIQNPKTKSPLSLNWQGVVIERISSSVVRFNLTNSYEPFLQNLTLKIIPKHIWENIPPEDLFHNEYNIKPIGTGPYLFDNLEKDSSGKISAYSLIANEHYFKPAPKITRLIFNFYDDYQSVKEALLKNEIEGFSPLSLSDYEFFVNKKSYQIKTLFLPRYFALFFNLNKTFLNNKDLRQALDLAIDRNELIKTILHQQAFALSGPISPGFWSYLELTNDFNPNQAQELINKIKNAKDAPPELKLTLSLPDSQELVEVAKFLVNSWEKIGVTTDLQILPLADLEKNVIQTRSYDILLFGEIISQDPDLFAFWHSSQITDPGLNLSAYKNKDLDKLLEETRQIQNQTQRLNNLSSIQQILNQDKPALFLYNPYYLYLLPNKVKGVSIEYANLPAERWLDITNWFIKTRRVLK